MSFNNFLNNAWNDHAKDAAGVAGRLAEGISLLEKNDQIPAIANLISHVMGEHLQQWEDGIALLKQLRSSAVFDSGNAGTSESAIVRSIAGLEVAGGLRESVDDFSVSDQIRILALAASALSETNAERAQQLFRSSILKSQNGLPKEDPANKSLAITGNNLACALEEKSPRTEQETALMILAAQTGRKYWEIAGGWLETERAEYRLSQTYLKAGQAELAADHARKCLDICKANNAAPLEYFFGSETLALAEKAAGRPEAFKEAVKSAEIYFSQLAEDDKSWCEATLKKLKE